MSRLHDFDSLKYTKINVNRMKIKIKELTILATEYAQWVADVRLVHTATIGNTHDESVNRSI